MSPAPQRRAWSVSQIATILVIALVVAILAHIAPECRTGRILLVADSRAPDRLVRLTVEYTAPHGGGAIQRVLWEGQPPRTPAIVNYAHRGEGGFGLFIRDPATGEWTRKLGGYIAASGETHVVVLKQDNVDYISSFTGDFHRPQSSETLNLIYDAYSNASDMLSCVDAGFALARSEEQNPVSPGR